MWLVLLVLAWASVLVQGALYDTFTGEPVPPEREKELTRLNILPWCAIEVAECDPRGRRRIDNSCNNPRFPPRGAARTPYGRLLPPIYGENFKARPAKNGEELPNVRGIRVAIISDGRRSSERHTQLVTHIGVFLTADITSLHDTANYVIFTRDCCKPDAEQDPRCLPIRVSDDDVHLRRSNVRCLNLTAPITYQRLGCVPANVPPARINTTPPMLEMSILYGNNEAAARRGFEGKGGRIKADMIKGKEWPPSGTTLCMQNKPELGETRCHDSANRGLNAIVGVNLFGLWFLRQHNQIARALEALNPCWANEELFMTAREVNIALWQQLLYYEFMPSLVGFEYLLKQRVVFNTHGHVDDFDEELEPQLSLEFVMGGRWFHVIQEGRLRFYNRYGKLVDEKAIVDFTLRIGALVLNNTLEGATLGAFRQPAGAADYIVDPDVGERILGGLQFASDVISSDLMKARDAGLPSYNHYRQFCGLPHARSFQDLKNWMPEQQVIALQTSYRDVEDIELMAGVISERPMRGSVMGPTLGCIIAEQMRRWRQSDRFWFEHSTQPGAFTAEQLGEIRKFLLSRLICDHGDQVDHIQPYAFLLPGPGNEMRKCSEIPKMDFEPWRSDECERNFTRPKEDYNSYFSRYVVNYDKLI